METEISKNARNIVLPGSRLSLANKEYVTGPGTYELRGYIYATLAGVMKIEENEKDKVLFSAINLIFFIVNNQ